MTDKITPESLHTLARSMYDLMIQMEMHPVSASLPEEDQPVVVPPPVPNGLLDDLEEGQRLGLVRWEEHDTGPQVRLLYSPLFGNADDRFETSLLVRCCDGSGPRHSRVLRFQTVRERLEFEHAGRFPAPFDADHLTNAVFCFTGRAQRCLSFPIGNMAMAGAVHLTGSIVMPGTLPLQANGAFNFLNTPGLR
jgi:hypothetical protein